MNKRELEKEMCKLAEKMNGLMLRFFVQYEDLDELELYSLWYSNVWKWVGTPKARYDV